MNAVALYTFLTKTPTITSLIGGPSDIPDTIPAGEGEAAPDARIYWKVKPQNELRTCLVLAIPTETPGQSLSGPDGYEAADLTITCFAPTYAEARDLAAAVSDAIDNQSIADEDYTVDDRTDLPIVPADGQETPLVHGVLISVTVET